MALKKAKPSTGRAPKPKAAKPERMGVEERLAALEAEALAHGFHLPHLNPPADDPAAE